MEAHSDEGVSLRLLIFDTEHIVANQEALVRREEGWGGWTYRELSKTASRVSAILWGSTRQVAKTVPDVESSSWMVSLSAPLPLTRVRPCHTGASKFQSAALSPSISKLGHDPQPPYL